jgi:hypothetical protein
MSIVSDACGRVVGMYRVRISGCRPHQFNNPEDEDRDGLRNVGLYKTEPPYPADSPRKLHYILI